MFVKRWAFLFVFLLSTDYIVAAAGSLQRAKRSVSCQLKPEVTDMFDRCFENVRTQMDDSVELQDNVVNNLQLVQGQVSNLKGFKRTTPLSCACLKDRIRIFIQISFIDITVTWLVTVLDGVLGGLLGNLGKTVTRLLGSVVNLLLNVLCLEINVIIAVDSKITAGSRCTVFSYHVTRITAIRILNIDLTQLVVGLLGDLLTPVIDTVVTQILSNQVRSVITQEIEKLSLHPGMHNCR